MQTKARETEREGKADMKNVAFEQVNKLEDLKQMFTSVFCKICPIDKLENFRNAFLALIAFLIGKPSEEPILISIGIIILLDYLTGNYISIKMKTSNSGKAIRGIIKWGIYFIMLIIAQIFDSGLTQYAAVNKFSEFVAIFIRVNIFITELISLLENCDVICILYKIKMPFISPLLKFLKKKSYTELKYFIKNRKENGKDKK